MPATPLLQGLPPVLCAGTRVLVLGSFPGAASLAAQQYYAHPRNHFWPLLALLWPQHPLLARGLGLWDVYGACAREGSLDSAIRSARLNDFGALHLPRLAAIVHNGGESFRHARRVRGALGPGARVVSLRLPSTSPANARWSLEKKRAAWTAALAGFGLL